MATARTPRSAWIDAGLRVLATGGPEAVRIEALARDLGVTKGGFYGYFADRNDLLAEMLDTWERRSVDDVLTEAESLDDDRLTRATTAARLTFSPELLPVDRAIRTWASHDSAVAERLRGVDDQRMDYLRTNFASAFTDPIDLEARCLLAFCAALAGETIAADHPGHTRAEILDRAGALLFGAP